MRYRLIAFDWDGTVVDSTGLIADCIQHAARDVGLSVPSVVDAQRVIGLGVLDSTRALFPGADDATLTRFMYAYRGHYAPRDNEVTAFSGIPALLEALRHDERFLTVATGKSRVGLERAFEFTGLKPHFHYSRCADEGFPKPHPDMLHWLMRVTGAAPEETLMIGDTVHDLVMAANAGCDAVGVTYGAHARRELEPQTARALLDSVDQLHEWLLAHG